MLERWAAGLPHQDHVYITTDELESFRFNNNELDEMSCKLDSTENPFSESFKFKKYPTPPLVTGAKF